jgi:hypothetical protein
MEARWVSSAFPTHANGHTKKGGCPKPQGPWAKGNLKFQGPRMGQHHTEGVAFAVHNGCRKHRRGCEGTRPAPRPGGRP